MSDTNLDAAVREILRCHDDRVIGIVLFGSCLRE
jgi:hypothetical protein